MIAALPSLGGFLASIGIVFLLSGAETAAIAANRRRFREDEAAGDRSAAGVTDLLEDLRRLLGATLAARVLAMIVAVASLRGCLGRLGFEWLDRRCGPGFFTVADWVALALVPPLLTGVGEILARACFRPRADAAIRLLTPPLYLLSAAMTPLVGGVQAVFRLLLRPLGGRRARAFSRDDLAELFGGMPEAQNRPALAPEESADLDTAAGSMIHNIVDLEKTRVCEVMRPLTDVVAIRLGETTIEGVKELARRTGFSKFPVFRERIIHLVGYVTIYDILRSDNPAKSRLEDFVREAYYAPESMRVNDLLDQFLDRQLTAAIVIDEYGACCGLVTREDLLEEIVGEIEDEFDDEAPTLLTPEGEGGCLCEAQIDIDDLNEALSTHFPKDGFETLGGWVYATLGRVPKPGDSAPFEDLVVEVAEMEGPVIHKVRIRPNGPS
jgi:CBS domain containing-hemolysin-like protein